MRREGGEVRGERRKKKRDHEGEMPRSPEG
jgi:hypothetical protein